MHDVFEYRKWRKKIQKYRMTRMGRISNICVMRRMPNEKNERKKNKTLNVTFFFVFRNLMVDLFGFCSSITLHHFIPFSFVGIRFRYLGTSKHGTMPRDDSNSRFDSLKLKINKIPFQPPQFHLFLFKTWNVPLSMSKRFNENEDQFGIAIHETNTQRERERKNLNRFQFCSSNRQIALQFEIRNKMHVSNVNNNWPNLIGVSDSL